MSAFRDSFSDDQPKPAPSHEPGIEDAHYEEDAPPAPAPTFGSRPNAPAAAPHRAQSLTSSRRMHLYGGAVAIIVVVLLLGIVISPSKHSATASTQPVATMTSPSSVTPAAPTSTQKAPAPLPASKHKAKPLRTITIKRTTPTAPAVTPVIKTPAGPGGGTTPSNRVTPTSTLPTHYSEIPGAPTTQESAAATRDLNTAVQVLDNLSKHNLVPENAAAFQCAIKRQTGLSIQVISLGTPQPFLGSQTGQLSADFITAAKEADLETTAGKDKFPQMKLVPIPSDANAYSCH